MYYVEFIIIVSLNNFRTVRTFFDKIVFSQFLVKNTHFLLIFEMFNLNHVRKVVSIRLLKLHSLFTH